MAAHGARYGCRYLGAYAALVAFEDVAGECGQQSLVVCQLLALSGHACRHCLEYFVAEGFEAVVCGVGAGYECLCCRRWGFDVGVGNVVEHCYVALVAYADYHRQGELGHVEGKGVVVEGGEVAHGSASAYYHHAVEVIDALHHRFEGGYDARYGAFALQRGFKEGCGEAQARGVAVEVLHEVAVSGSATCRHHCHAGRHCWPLQGAVEVEYAFGL